MKIEAVEKNVLKAMLVISVVVAGFFLFGTNASASETVIRVGNGEKIINGGKNYKTSDADIAYVTEDGVVVGKKAGAVVVSARKNGKRVKRTVVVKPKGKIDNLRICADEISIEKQSMEYTPIISVESGDAIVGYSYKSKITVKNNSGVEAKKIMIAATISGSSVTYKCKDLASGKSATISVEGTVLDESQVPKLKSITVYKGKYNHSYSFATDRRKADYSTADTTAPVITGFIGKNSYNNNCWGNKIPYQTVYSDTKDNFDYFKYVKATDDRDKKVKLTVDTSKINYKKSGVYKVKYKAVDSAGNIAKASAYIQYRVADDLEDMCDTILGRIIKTNWSDESKARAIHDYVRGHMSYAGSSNKHDWVGEAKKSFRYGSGDCFNYYSPCRALLTRAGIPNLEVTRVQGYGHHWWNMVYIDGEFYHLDACPRAGGGRFCLLTDSQLTDYSNSHGHSHIWDYSGKPKSGTKVISSVF